MQQTIEFDALGTHWWIELPATDSVKLAKQIHKTVTEFENNYSRFKDSSLVSQLNSTKVLHDPSEEFAAMLQFGLEMYTQTNGIFNMSVGAQLEADGYGSGYKTNTRVSHNLLHDVTVTKTKVQIADHVRLDFGGFGKGWLVDSLAALLDKHGVEFYIINGGGDIRVKSTKPVAIALEHPLASDQMIGTVSLSSGALASSSVLKRRWTKDGVEKNHIIDTKKASGVRKPIAGFTTAPTALLADTISTVLLLANDADRQKIAQQNGVAYLLLQPDLTPVLSRGFTANLN